MKGTISESRICIVLFLAFALTGTSSVFSQTDKEVEQVLQAAELTFKSMKSRDYKSVWNSITSKSRDKIIDDVYKGSAKVGEKYSREQISKDFEVCSVICKAYWKSFTENFDPNMVLENSEWSIGFIKKNEAEVVLRYKKSEHPAKLKMFKEKNEWKVGLVETFWSRK